MSTIEQNLQHVRQRITAAVANCVPSRAPVTLLAVSKTKPTAAIAEAIAAGQRAFGENYVQEGVDKIHYFAAHPESAALEWHFIGPLQANKSRLVAENFQWCHTVDRVKIATRLNAQRPPQQAPLNVLIQVNISDENSKSGVKLAEVAALAAEIAIMPQLRLRGLMAIPAPETDYQRQLAVFQLLGQAFTDLQQQHPQIDTLSMGMTDDMEAAIAAGSTLVRIGTAIFGARDYGHV